MKLEVLPKDCKPTIAAEQPENFPLDQQEHS